MPKTLQQRIRDLFSEYSYVLAEGSAKGDMIFLLNEIETEVNAEVLCGLRSESA